MTSLKEYYNNVYAENKDQNWNDYQNKNNLGDSHQFVIDQIAEQKITTDTILDVGCGKGNFLAFFKNAVRRCGIDFSEVAISCAKNQHKNIDFILGDESSISGQYDLVTSFGVIEHTDNPSLHFKKLYESTKKGGSIFIACPNHCNIRGIIWQTLSLLFNVPMSLADRHVIGFNDIKKLICVEDKLIFFTIDDNISMKQGMIKDLTKRLPNALSDANMSIENVPYLLNWLEENYQFFESNKYSGWTSIFHILKA